MPVPQNTTPTPQAGGEWARKTDTRAGVTAQALLPATPNQTFFLVSDPESWEVETEGLDGPTWLPILRQDRITPGAGLKRTISKGESPEAAYDLSHLQQQRRGSTVIRRDKPIGGVVDYVHAIACRDPISGAQGEFFLLFCETPEVQGQGRRLKLRLDRKAWNQFRAALVTEGIVPPPAPYVLQGLLQDAQAAVLRRKQTPNLTPEARKDLVAAASGPADLAAKARIPGRAA